MINNKKRKRKKVKREIIYRTKEERQKEVKTILGQLSEFDLDSKYEPIKKLYGLLKTYITEGNRMIVNIPFPEISLSGSAKKALLTDSPSNEIVSQ